MHLGTEYYTDDEIRAAGFASVGENVKVKKNAELYFIENISLGNNVRIDGNSVIVASGEPVSIGSYVHIASGCYIAGSAGFRMEDFSGLSPGVLIFTGSDDYLGTKMTNPTLPKKYIGGKTGSVALEKHVIIGAGTIILPDLTIGEGSSVGSLSLVRKSLDPWGVYAGNPLKRLTDRKKDLLALERELLAQPQQ